MPGPYVAPTPLPSPSPPAEHPDARALRWVYRITIAFLCICVVAIVALTREVVGIVREISVQHEQTVAMQVTQAALINRTVDAQIQLALATEKLKRELEGHARTLEKGP